MEKQPGKKHKDELKEKAFALLVSNNASYVAKELGLPYSTVKTWENKFIKEGRKKIANGETSQNDEDNLVKLRNKKREEFVNSAWENIELADKLIKRKLKRALEQEDQIDELIAVANEELDEEESEKNRSNEKKRQRICSKIDALKLDNLSQISTTLGTLYDKQALANGEATSREETIIKGFEDY